MFFDWGMITEASGVGAKKKHTGGSGPNFNTGNSSDIATSSGEDSLDEDIGETRPRTTAHARKASTYQ
jgi:hypothetical protein